ncbi:MAG TPA: SurA N-terminal domain-containing protein [Anaerolineae bacterium]|nr:SurA N-terminal domain-containing protein [Anaerolineae bacterium]
MSKNPHTSQFPKELSRKQISRAEREARSTRVLVLSVGGALLLAILLIAFGALREAVFIPNEPVALVGDQQILTREFQQRVRLQRFQLIQQYNFYANLGLQDNATQAFQALSDARGIGSQVVNTLVNEALYRQAAPELGVTVTADEVQQELETDFNYFRITPTPAPTRTPLPTPMGTITITPEPTFTPQPTATPVTLEGFQSLFQQQLGSLAELGLNEADYRRLYETQLLVQRVEDILTRDTVTITAQTQFQYIRATTRPDIDAVQQAVEQDGFDTVYGQVLSQTFPITSVTASEVPFTPKEELAEFAQFGPAAADTVFSTPISSTFGVVTSTDSSLYYLGQVLDRQVLEIPPDILERRRTQRIQDWLSERQALLSVKFLTWEDRVPSEPSLPISP